uniref:Uncharacterized protein n=1 Tax=Anguilla anguilla TaxID=7936 RepID=A0A0E9UAR7_ANGAN
MYWNICFRLIKVRWKK